MNRPIALDAPDVTKRPNQKLRYSEQQVMDLIRCQSDPLYFAQNFIKVQHPIRGMIPFHPYPFQVRMMNGFYTNRFVVNITGRQMGKSVSFSSNVLADGKLTRVGQLIPLSFREKLVTVLENILLRLAAKI